MKQPTVALNFARLFAATGLVLFFLTSCSNYWLHAVTCPSVNSTGQGQDMINGTENLPDRNQEAVFQKPFAKESSDATGNSTGMNQELNSPVAQQQKGASKKQRWPWRPGGRTPFFLKDQSVTYHHEGFFWRCWFTDQWKEDTISKFIFINQPPLKCCIHAYYSPFPSINGKTTPAFESALVYRRWWSALMLLAVIFITIGFIIITFKAFCENYRMYKAVGIIFLLSGIFFTLSIITYACWISAVSQMIPQETTDCSVKGNSLSFGWSFMAAPVGIFFSLFAGLLFFKVAGTACQEEMGII